MANTSINSAVVTFVKYDSNGNMDLDASCEAFQTALLNYQETSATMMANVSEAVHIAFDRHAVKQEEKATKTVVEVLQMPQLLTFAMACLNVTAETYSDHVEAIDAFVRSSPEFLVSRGRNGGVKRLYK